MIERDRNIVVFIMLIQFVRKISMIKIINSVLLYKYKQLKKKNNLKFLLREVIIW